MRILALDTSDTTGSVALLHGEHLVASRQLAARPRAAQTLTPTIKSLLDEAGWTPKQVELFAVVTGPGSFTGLRVGVTTAKTFCYATGAGVLGVHTLAAIAAQAPAEALRLHVAIDAQRQQVFCAVVERPSEDAPQSVGPTEIVSQSQWLAQLQPGDLVSGPILERLAGQLPESVLAVDPALWRPQAETVGRLALRPYETSGGDDLWKLTPAYYRQSAAEEKWAARGEG